MSAVHVRAAAVLGACLAGALLVGSCSVGVQRQPVVLGPGKLREPTSTATVANNGTRLARVYLVRDNQLVPAYRPEPSGRRASAVLRALAEPISQREQRRGLRTALPGSKAPPISVHGGVAYVGVPGGFARLGVSEQVLAVGQITLTLSMVHGIVAVQLVHGGHDVDIPVAGGELQPGPVTAADYQSLVADGSGLPRSTTSPGSPRIDRSTSGSPG
jgi:hypothetical protein